MFPSNRRGFLTAAALALPALESARASAQTVPVDRQVLETDTARTEAMVKSDATALDRLLAADVTYVTSAGRLEDKMSLMFAATSKTRTYDRYIATEQKARVTGNVAIVTGVAAVRGSAGEDPFDIGARYTAVYVRRDARWQLAAYQETPLATPGRVIGGESA